MGTILRFNWPFYLTAGVVLIAAVAGLAFPLPIPWKLLCAGAAVGAGYFLLVSLGVSHLVYDRSDLYRFGWLDRALGNVPTDHVVFCHSGFDDLSEAIQEKLLPNPRRGDVNTPLPVGRLPSGGGVKTPAGDSGPTKPFAHVGRLSSGGDPATPAGGSGPTKPSADVGRLPSGGDPAAPAEGSGPTVVNRSPHWITLDHFDPKQMTEASIRRARQLCPPTAGTVSAPFDAWPVESSSADVVFGLLAIHEFRSESERTRWFAEARRSLKPGGRVVIAEHLRDPASFLAYGPGFLHFHSAASWRRCWEAAGLRARDEFPVTPWVRVFVLIAP
jgi:hypothetical protein